MIGAPAQQSAAQLAATTPRTPGKAGDGLGRSGHSISPVGVGASGPQQLLDPPCIGGHASEPKEQKTQQSPAFGRMTVRQAALVEEDARIGRHRQRLEVPAMGTTQIRLENRFRHQGHDPAPVALTIVGGRGGEMEWLRESDMGTIQGAIPGLGRASGRPTISL
jgi:hypothetical protein